MKITAYYVKTSIIATLLFAESFLLSGLILSYINSQKFFSPSLDFMVLVAVLMLLILVTHALIVGAWDKWEQFIFGPISISLGLFITTFPINSAYAVVIFFLSYVLLFYEVILASQLKRQMLVFNPRLVLKFTTKGIILIYSLSAAILVIVTAGKQPDFNVGNKVGEFVDMYFTTQINTEMNAQVQEGLSPEQMERLSAFGLDPTKFNYSDGTETPYILENMANVSIPELSLKNTVANEVNKLVDPYKRFVNPIMAIMVFGLIQFLGTIAYLFYSLSIDIVFWAAKKFGLFTTETVQAEQEILHF